MALREDDYRGLLIRAKKMAGALGAVPTEGELVDRFAKKDTTITVTTAARLVSDVRASWAARAAGGEPQKAPRASRRKSGETQAEPQAPIEQKPESKPAVAPTERSYAPPPKTSTNYGR